MKDFAEQIETKRGRKRHIEKTIKKVLAGAALVGAAVIFTGFYDGDQRLVTETYTVKEGDTLWSIATEYLKKNTGGRRYILEFMDGVRENNPWLLETHDQLQPGDKLTITYWREK